jgi:hypothetical protein
MQREEFSVTIVSKDKREVGFFFKGVRHYVTIRFEDGHVMERMMPLQDYYDLEVGGNYLVTMYSRDGDMWYFTEAEARI